MEIIPMENKQAVCALQEFCSKSGKNLPIYEFAIGREGDYICKVTAVEMESSGNGPNKREAKHMAAENIWRKLCEAPEVSTEIQNLNRDMLRELRDYCSLYGMPAPITKDVEQKRSCDAPEFVIRCSVGAVVCYGKSDKKKYARQQAAGKVLSVITDEMTAAFENMTLESKKTFNTFKNLGKTESVNKKAVPLCDRHNYFKNFCPELKEAAFEVIRSDKYRNTKDKAMSLMSALKLKPSIDTVESTSVDPLLKVDLNCEFDCLILGMESEIYEQIIEYFKVMLV
ncbi:uncharacterized protein LOC110177007 isoform X2 [Drosophila serrata]|uniref:uncharacterized protein LOC110177007 isoform X2 n=1 Tax=Drosophila serrata TaxID=7274 RepID=UPI000A1D1137|nr:uncharacterized protein LOC110177007 isoform X2 [Drosophila serrata]